MLLTVLAWLYALAKLLGRFTWLRRLGHAVALRLWCRCPLGYRRAEPPQALHRKPAKPEWARKEILRLKALMPHAGCRSIADSFNGRFAARKRTSVGKTFVFELLRKHRHEIEILRRRIKNARPRLFPKNLIWALDLTGKTPLDGSTRIILGILEHASRAALALEALESKSSWALILKLVDAIERYGKPHMVRTDNEAVFTSRVFRLGLFVLGIRHQRTDPGCPWQNGRIERFFGTLKDQLDRLAVDSFETLNLALGEFRFFYNHVRAHQNLGGWTPAEAWSGTSPFANAPKSEYWFEAWDGLLTGYYLRR
jgi:Transposase and inactivated derivatives